MALWKRLGVGEVSCSDLVRMDLADFLKMNCEFPLVLRISPFSDGSNTFSKVIS
jgi:hypothetical protein